ncbi:unnamed protein product, partial [Notodromas monacha]
MNHLSISWLCVLLLTVVVFPSETAAEPQQRWLGQPAADVTNADIRDSMIGLHTALTELKEKFEKHDVREKTTANSLLNSVRRIASATKTMETVAVNLGRMDVRLANLE